MASKKSAVLILGILVIVLAGIAVVSNRNKLAKVDPAKVDLILSSNDSKIAVGSTFTIDVYANTNGLSISAADLKIRYDQTKLQLLSFKSQGGNLPTTLKEPVIDNNGGSMWTIIGALVDANKAYPKSGKNLLMGQLTFKSIAEGNAFVKFDDKIQVAATGQTSNVAGALTGIAIDNYAK